jgi:type IV secretory pathway TrbL component
MLASMDKLKPLESWLNLALAIIVAFIIANNHVGLITGVKFTQVGQLVLEMLALFGFTVSGPGFVRGLVSGKGAPSGGSDPQAKS